MMPQLILKPGREKSLLRRHPWIFSGAVAAVREDATAGDTVDVLDSHGNFLARAAYSPHSQIRARVWSWDPRIAIAPQFFQARISRALAVRQAMVGLAQTNALRLIHAESDGLPGLVVDRFDDTLVMQCLSTGAERWRDTLADLLLELSGAGHIFERSDADVRALEGLPARVGVLRGSEPPARLRIYENDLRFWVDIRRGHKTGFYLDQRDNRSLLRELVPGKEVLDCFSYTGGFTIAALAGGAASVMAVDSSGDALAMAKENLDLNSLPVEGVEFVEGDVFQVLRAQRDRDRSFDLVILDPPKFAPTAAQAERAARGYKDINLMAFKLLRPGGLLVTFSCSSGVSEELFQKIVAGAALDAGVEAKILTRLHQGPDHPVALNFPEGAYLKGFIISI
jgi:23S rRNA (cytosine1962-C5)-methyltransferase